MLMLAKATSKPVSFYWSSVGSCTDANPVYASPDYISSVPTSVIGERVVVRHPAKAVVG